jgi:phosphoribosylformimino-5-aminoimidazole carboxamide ribotide isomerase
VVVGTRAIEEPAWLQAMAQRYPSKLVVAADVRGDEVVTRGWKHGTGTSLGALLATLGALELGGVLVTAVHVEGQQGGTDLEVMTRARSATRHPLIASGGVTTVDDVRALARLGVDAAVIGMALYTGRLDAAALPPEFK